MWLCFAFKYPCPLAAFMRRTSTQKETNKHAVKSLITSGRSLQSGRSNDVGEMSIITLSVFVFSVAVHFRKFQCVWECAGCGSGEGICVIVWPSQPSHELLGPGSDTEAGFVRAFGTPRSLVHTTARGYTNAHTHHAQTKAQNG